MAIKMTGTKKSNMHKAIALRVSIFEPNSMANNKGVKAGIAQAHIQKGEGLSGC